MPLTDYADLIAHITAPSVRLSRQSVALSGGGDVERWRDLMFVLGFLATASPPGATNSGPCNRDTYNALIALPPPPVGATLRKVYAHTAVDGWSPSSNYGAEAVLFADRLVQTDGLIYTAGAEQTTRLNQPLPPRASGRPVQAWLKCWAAPTNAATATASVRGLGSNAQEYTVAMSAAAGGAPFAFPAVTAETMARIPDPAPGVMWDRILGVTITGGTAVGGNLGVVMLSPLWLSALRARSHAVGYEESPLHGQNAVAIPADACLMALLTTQAQNQTSRIDMDIRLSWVPD